MVYPELYGSGARPRGVDRHSNTKRWFRATRLGTFIRYEVVGAVRKWRSLHTPNRGGNGHSFETNDRTDNQLRPGLIESYHGGKACRISPSESTPILLDLPCYGRRQSVGNVSGLRL